ncbi:hypothetical protein QYE76_004893 [Lolium multiflorum]|uniref:CCHC-type domain-containing protein n=1 Tax=Lolium multiflorum TaxID=4521 RepID=A0AAD8RSU5_LOLMU|nr:hypothetical protein QYE76_004893 [Lolium multiflorum]
MATPSPSPCPSPSPAGSPRGRADRWRGGRGSDSEDTPSSFRDALMGARTAESIDVPESSRARREVRSMVRREEASTAIDALDDSDDLIDEEGEEGPWEEPAHVTRKRARGRRGGKKVAARPVRPAREVGAYADYEGMCLLCTQPGHHAVDCITGPVCLRCGETGHMARECSLPRPPRPSSPPDGEEPARKGYHRVGESANDLRARAPEGRQAAVEPRGRHREVAPDPRVASRERRVTANRRGAPAPPRARQGVAFARRDVPAAVAARTVAPVPALVARELPAGGDRVVAPVLPAVRRGTDAARPRRSADEQVAPLGLRRPAFGGELARRPARASCVLPRTPEMDEAEEALAKALLAVIVGVRRTVTAEEVAMALEDVHGLAPGSFSVHCHRPEDFLLYFASQVDRDRVLGDGVLASPYFRLLLRPWSRRTHAASGGLCVHTELEIEGVPANAWSLATAEAVLAPTAWVERLHPLTRSRADMGVLRLTAWCLDPAAIPREVDLHVVEPDDPPSLADMAAPSQAVVPPHISTLVYPLLVHVTRTVVPMMDGRLPGRRCGNTNTRAGCRMCCQALAAAALLRRRATVAEVVAPGRCRRGSSLVRLTRMLRDKPQSERRAVGAARYGRCAPKLLWLLRAPPWKTSVMMWVGPLIAP